MRIFQLCLVTTLLAVTSCTHNPDDKTIAEAGSPLFVKLDQDRTQISFQNTLTEGLNTNILMYEYFYNGGGVAAADFNGDELVDLYFTSNMGENKFYLNKGSNKFQDISLQSAATGRPGPWKTGVNAVDINGDGKLDIYLCYSGAMPAEKRANQLFVNKGNNAEGIPVFEEQAAAYGLASTGFSNQSYFLDYDKDGDLDMLLLNHNPKNLPILNEASTAEMFRVDNADKGLRLFRQDNGKFIDVTVTSGINGSELSYGLGLGISDFNQDGWPDFYVSNDYAVPDFYYINNGNGTFSNQLKNSIGHTSQFSMGNDVADINNDSYTDIFTLDMLPEDNHRQKLLLAPDNYDKFNLNVRIGFYYQYMRNMLHRNNGNGTYSEIGQLAGVSNTDWSWSALLADYDNDGWKDLFVTNGYFRDYTNLDFINYMNEFVQQKGRLQREDVMQIIQQMPSSNVSNYIFRNSGNGLFTKANANWGITETSNSNGAVYADLDNDGDLDLVVNNINQPAFVYENRSQHPGQNNFLQVKLAGDKGNTQGLGAHIKIYYNGQVQSLEQNPARGYLSSVSNLLHFGLGKAGRIDSLVITWNSGKTERKYQVNTNQVITLAEKDAVEPPTVHPPASRLFVEFVPGINRANSDTAINDFNRQPLLINQFSYQGPCMAKSDLNKDGLEDLVIGGQAGIATAVYLQQKNGGFIPSKIPAFEQDKQFVDASMAVFDANNDGLPDVYIASGGYNQLNAGDSLLQDRLYLNTGRGQFLRSKGLPAIAGSKSCVQNQDINGDGFEDLFVGGRVIPGRYPESPGSFILINDGAGNFTDQTEKYCPDLRKSGMVTDAIWVDLDMDNKKELVIVGEWMPVTIFHEVAQRLENVTAKFLDQSYTGWWNTIAAADLNGDQRPDLVVGNQGLNTQFRASDKEPLDLYANDFDQNGSVDPIFSFYIQGKKYPYVTRDELVSQLPAMRKRFANFKSYADITMDELFQESALADAYHLSATHMATTCFLSNATGKLIPAELPVEAQFSPVYTIDVLDVNADGQKDLLLCGNNSHSKIRLGKYDANFGVLLEGNGKGQFRYIPQYQSGLNLWGDIRSTIRINNNIYFGRTSNSLVAYTLKQNKP